MIANVFYYWIGLIKNIIALPKTNNPLRKQVKENLDVRRRFKCILRHPKNDMSRNVRKCNVGHVQPAKIQIRLRIRAV